MKFHKNCYDELIINGGQTPSKFVLSDNITMAAKGQKHVSRAGFNGKRSSTLTLCESLDGKILPFQLIYKGKTQRLLPIVDFPDGFCLTYNEKNWSNETPSPYCSLFSLSLNTHYSNVFHCTLNKNHRGIQRLGPSILLSRSLCHILRSLKKKKVYQTIKKVSLYGTLLKLNLQPIYLMFYQSTELNLLWYQRT